MSTMKSLIVLFSLLAVSLGSVSSGSAGVPVGVRVDGLPAPQGSQYRVESKHVDGSIAGQYGYQTNDQKVQVAYATGQAPIIGQKYTARTTDEVTATDVETTAEEIPKIEKTTLTTPVELKPLPLETTNTQAVTYGTYYPVAQPGFNYYYHVKPVTTGVYPAQQHFSYSQTAPFVPVSGQSFNGYYFPNYFSGQQPFYSHPTNTYGFGGAPQSGRFPTTYTPGQADVSFTPQIFTGQIGQVGAPAFPTGGASVFTGQSGTPSTTSQVFTGQGAAPAFTSPIDAPVAAQVYTTGQHGVSGISPSRQTGSSGVLAARYRHSYPSIYYDVNRPSSTYYRFAQRYGYYPSGQYRTTY